jgi:hypothetical protein
MEEGFNDGDREDGRWVGISSIDIVGTFVGWYVCIGARVCLIFGGRVIGTATGVLVSISINTVGDVELIVDGVQLGNNDSSSLLKIDVDSMDVGAMVVPLIISARSGPNPIDICFNILLSIIDDFSVRFGSILVLLVSLRYVNIC